MKKNRCHRSRSVVSFVQSRIVVQKKGNLEKDSSVWLENYSESREKKRCKHTTLNFQGKEERSCWALEKRGELPKDRRYWSRNQRTKAEERGKLLTAKEEDGESCRKREGSWLLSGIIRVDK